MIRVFHLVSEMRVEVFLFQRVESRVPHRCSRFRGLESRVPHRCWSERVSIFSCCSVSLDEPSESNEETDSFTYLPERDLRAPVNVGSIYEFMGGVATGGSSKGTVKHKNSLHKVGIFFPP